MGPSDNFCFQIAQSCLTKYQLLNETKSNDNFELFDDLEQQQQ